MVELEDKEKVVEDGYKEEEFHGGWSDNIFDQF